jgi:hypothetical protein
MLPPTASVAAAQHPQYLVAIPRQLAFRPRPARRAASPGRSAGARRSQPASRRGRSHRPAPAAPWPPPCAIRAAPRSKRIIRPAASRHIAAHARARGGALAARADHILAQHHARPRRAGWGAPPRSAPARHGFPPRCRARPAPPIAAPRRARRSPDTSLPTPKVGSLSWLNCATLSVSLPCRTSTRWPRPKRLPVRSAAESSFCAATVPSVSLGGVGADVAMPQS